MRKEPKIRLRKKDVQLLVNLIFPGVGMIYLVEHLATSYSLPALVALVLFVVYLGTRLTDPFFDLLHRLHLMLGKSERVLLDLPKATLEPHGGVVHFSISGRDRPLRLLWASFDVARLGKEERVLFASGEPKIFIDSFIVCGKNFLQAESVTLLDFMNKVFPEDCVLPGYGLCAVFAVRNEGDEPFVMSGYLAATTRVLAPSCERCGATPASG